MASVRLETAGMLLRSERGFSLGIALLIVCVVWIFVPQLASPFDVKRHVLIAGALLLALSFSRRQVRVPWKIPSGLLGFALLMLVLSALVSAAAAQNKLLSGAQLAQLTALLLLALCIFNLREFDAAARIELAVIVAATGVALLALGQWLLPDVFDLGLDATAKMRVYSTLGNSNLAAFALLAALPLAFFRARQAHGVLRALGWLIVILLSIALISTQSRQAVSIALLLMPVGFVWLGSTRTCTIALVLSGVVIAAIVAASILQWIAWPPTLTHTIKGRVLIWASAASMLGQHPLAGVGLGHFELYHTHAQALVFASGHYDAFADNAGAVKDAHNDFLQWGATAGAWSLIAFVGLCLSVLVKGWRSQAVRAHAPGLYLSLIGCIGMTLFTALLPYAATALVFWVVFGLVLRRSDTASFTWTPPRLVSYGYIAMLAAGFAGICAWSYRDLRAELLEARGNRLMEQHDPWLAEQAYHDALTWSRNGQRLRSHATTLFLADQPRAALIELEEASRYAGDIGIGILQAEILTRLGEYDRAISIYQDLIAAFPKMITPRFVLAQIYAVRGERDLAQAQFRRIVQIEPSPFNQSMTREKVELQKSIARRYLEEADSAQRP